MKHIKLYNQFLNEGTLDELKTVFNENIELDPLVDRLNKVKAKVNFSGNLCRKSGRQRLYVSLGEGLQLH